MMLRTRSTGRRIIASRIVSGSYRPRGGHHLRVVAAGVDEIAIYRRPSSSLHLLGGMMTHASALDDNIPNNKQSKSLHAYYFSTSPSPDFDDSSPDLFDMSLDFETDDLPDESFPEETYEPLTKNEPKPKSDQDHGIPKQSNQSARILFQSIAPHVEFRTFHQLMKQVTKMISMGQNPKIDTNNRSGKKETLKRRLGQLFDKTSSDTSQYSWSVKSHLWLQPLLYQFFMGKFLDHPDSIQFNAGDPKNQTIALPKSLSYQTDSTYPPNRNRSNFQKNVKTLLKAREMSLQYPMFWTLQSMRDAGFYAKNGKQKVTKSKRVTRAQRLHSEKTGSQLAKEGEVLLELLMHKLPQPHFEKVMNLLEKFAEVDGNIAAKARESWYIDDEGGPSTPPSKGAKSVKKLQLLKEIAPKETKQGKITVLGNALCDLSSSHSHLVAVELGRYFYVDLLTHFGDVQTKRPPDNNGGDDDNQLIPSATVLTDLFTLRPQDVASAIRKHRKLSDTEKKYQKLKDNFVDRMIQLQHEFASWEDDTKSESESEDNDADDGSDDDLASDLLVKEFQKEQMNYKADVRQEQQEALAETLLKLREMGLRKDDDEVRKRRGRPKKGTHVRFTAVKMEGDDSPLPSEPTEDEAELEQRIVFINNLPIDTTQEEIDQIYSRCGPLDSIQLFNLRPDLDPGPLSKAQLDERRRKQRLGNPDMYRPRRPRTPVYGILTFQTTEGFNTATRPEMSLFGCVIRRHPVMSIKPNDMTTLYIENIPQNLMSVELEYKLARLLHPHKMYVMQDGMEGVGGGSGGYQHGVISSDNIQEYSEPSTCEVNFDDFHAANAAYSWMIGENVAEERPNAAFMGSEDCEVHWFRTPRDKMKYWTRELNF